MNERELLLHRSDVKRLTILFEVVPLTIESSTITTRFPQLCFQYVKFNFTEFSRIACDG